MSDVYTAEVVTSVTDRYVELRDSGADYDKRSALVKEIAEELGVKEASVRQKLVSLRVYKAKETTKETSTGVTKEDLAKAFGSLMGRDMTSLTKSSKADVQALWDYFIAQSEQANVEIARLREALKK